MASRSRSLSWKRPEGAFDVAVQVAQQLALRNQRRNEATALVDRRSALGAVAQLDGARDAGLFEPRRDGAQQRGFALAARNQRAGEPQAFGRFQYQQHPLGARQFGGFVDQKLVQFVGAIDLVQAQPGIDQALEGLAQRGRADQVGLALLARQTTFARCRHPGGDHFARHLRLVQHVAAQALVAEPGHGVEHEAVGLCQGFVRRLGAARRQ